MNRTTLDRWLAAGPVSEWALYQTVGVHLTGRAVEVRFRAPARAKAVGWCDVDEWGNLRIDVKPDLLPSRRLEVLLHECAHGRLHAELIEPSLTHRMESRSLPALDPATKAAHAPREREAEELAERWIQLARNHSGEFRVQPLELRPLLALLVYGP